MGFLLRRVQGESMSPRLSRGQIVIARTAKLPKIGDMVLFRHEGRDKIKIIRQLKRNEMYVEGLHAHSTDSRSFGWLPVESIAGVIIWPRR